MVDEVRHGAGPALPRASYLAGAPAAPLALQYAMVIGHSYGQHHARHIGQRNASQSNTKDDVLDNQIVAGALTTVYEGKAYIPTHAKRVRARLSCYIFGSLDIAQVHLRVTVHTAVGTTVSVDAADVTTATFELAALGAQIYSSYTPTVVIAEVDVTGLTLGQLHTFDVETYAEDSTNSIILKWDSVTLWWDHQA